MPEHEFDVYKEDRKDGKEAYDCSSHVCQGRFATVHSFDIFPDGIITRLLNSHYYPRVSDESIRAKVKEKRGK